MIHPPFVFPDQPLTHGLSMCFLKFIWFGSSRHFCLSLMFFSTAWVHKCGANYVFHSKYVDSFTNIRHEQLCPGMGKIINMPVIDLGSYRISFWNCNIKIENYCITFLLFSMVDERSSENIEWIQFNTNYQWYLFETSQNYIITSLSSWFELDFCTQNNIKPIILY